jgi:hypothetical protein
MLSRWMAIHASGPENLSTRDAIVHLSTNVFAVQTPLPSLYGPSSTSFFAIRRPWPS